MDTQALRQKILDLAIRGKLVPQDPDDEPASVLLERIRAERQQMVKDGKLKAKDIKCDTIIFKGDDNLHYEKFQDGTVKCIEDEIPFEVPEGWAWERLGNIVTIARGGSPRPIKAYITTADDGINWIKIGDTEKNGKYIFSTREKIKPEGMSKSRYVKSGDFLLTNSMSFGRPYILRTDGCIHDGWLVIGNVENIFNQDYLYYALSADFMYKILAILAGGSTVDNLNSDLVKSVLFPIPPMKEQTSIAQKIESSLNYAEQIMQKQKNIEETILQCKSKILDLAIRGKLVQQDASDEPASVLLERIKAEKEELIQQGKIKRDKNDSVIYKGDDNSYYEQLSDGTITLIDDDIPFDIPDSWLWVRLGSICPYGDCIKIAPQNISKNEWILDLEDIEKETGVILAHVKNEKHNSISTKHQFNKGQLLYSKLRPYLNKVVVADADGYCTSEILPLTFWGNISSEYMQIYLMSSTFLSYVNMISYGVKMPRLGTTDGKKALICIPPICEQKRIVEATQNSILYLNQIVESLS